MSTAIKLTACLTPEQSELAELHMPLVTAVARAWKARCRGGIDPADLEQAGMMGLLEAAQRFNPRKDVAFGAFAQLRIRGAICDFLRAQDPLTRRRRRAVRAVEGTSQSLATDLGREATASELGEQLGWEGHRVDEARADATALRRGWAQVQGANPDDVHAVPCPRPSQHDALAASELRSRLVALIKALPEREKLVLSLHYMDDVPLKDVAKILGVTPSRASQLHAAALGRLRKAVSVPGPEAGRPVVKMRHLVTSCLSPSRTRELALQG